MSHQRWQPLLVYLPTVWTLHNNSILCLVFQLFFIRGTPLHLSKLQHLLWFMPLSTNKKPLVSSRQCSCGVVDCSDLYLCERVMNSPCLSKLHICSRVFSLLFQKPHFYQKSWLVMYIAPLFLRNWRTVPHSIMKYNTLWVQVSVPVCTLY